MRSEVGIKGVERDREGGVERDREWGCGAR